jgi:hypothetical protein
MKSYLIEAIRKLKPNSEFVISNDDYATIEWHVLEGKAPNQAEIDKTIEQVKADEIVEAETKAAQRQAILDRLGLTADEAKLLLG